MLNEIKLAKLPGLAEFRLANEAEIAEYLGGEPGFIGPLGPRQAITVVADRSVAAMADFVIGANAAGYHLRGVNWMRDVPEPDLVADIRNVQAGDTAADGSGALQIARGIEVGHVFQLGQKYAAAMGAHVLDAQGKAQTPFMGCYGIGVSRIVAAAIEQNHDAAGIRWPWAMAPWQVAICVINPKNVEMVDQAATALYSELQGRGIEVVLDDRGLRPGAMFADIELIGIPQRVVVSERGLAVGQFEYRRRDASDSEMLNSEQLLTRIRADLP
jgi:prolyl-tRNA synthetase